MLGTDAFKEYHVAQDESRLSRFPSYVKRHSQCVNTRGEKEPLVQPEHSQAYSWSDTFGAGVSGRVLPQIRYNEMAPLHQISGMVPILVLLTLLVLNQQSALAEVMAHGLVQTHNHLFNTRQIVPFTAYISSNGWRLKLHVPLMSKTETNSYDLTEFYDGTNRFRCFELNTNPAISANPRLDQQVGHNASFEVMVFQGECPLPGTPEQNILWFSLASRNLLSSAHTTNIVMSSLFPGVGIGDYLFDQTNRYFCSVGAYLPGSHLPEKAYFIASEKLWKEERAGLSVIQWPFHDGYIHALYEVTATQVVDNITMPKDFKCHIYWPSNVVELKNSDELYTLSGKVDSVEELGPANEQPIVLTNAELTVVRDYRLNGEPPAVYLLDHFDGVPDVDSPIVKAAFAASKKIAHINQVDRPNISAAFRVVVRVVLLIFLVMPVIWFYWRRHEVNQRKS